MNKNDAKMFQKNSKTLPPPHIHLPSCNPFLASPINGFDPRQRLIHHESHIMDCRSKHALWQGYGEGVPPVRTLMKLLKPLCHLFPHPGVPGVVCEILKERVKKYRKRVKQGHFE